MSDLQTVTVSKLVHGGQGLGELESGKKVLVWNALPGETVKVRVIKNKKSYAEGIAEEIVTSSKDRIEPEEPASYLATSPWQIMSWDAENKHKLEILKETFEREKVTTPKITWVSEPKQNVRASGPGLRSESRAGELTKPEEVFYKGYRNKMEWGFWGDEGGLSVAHFVRGSHGKTKVVGSILADDFLNSAAHELVGILNTAKVRASDLKSVIIRTNRNGDTVAALFVKREDFIKIEAPKNLQGLAVYYSNPKSPASVATKLLYEYGDTTLTDEVLGVPLRYDVLSFFQGNLAIFEMAVEKIQRHVIKAKNIVDMYSGVGSIGIPIKASMLVEIDEHNVSMAQKNCGNLPIEVIHASSESALECITPETTLILDPPRAGLHKKLIERLLESRPPMIIYLSCNPATQARDIAMLQESYKVTDFEGYNFFPRTPHIESLAILTPSKA